MEVTLNPAQKLFIINSGNSVSSLGFRNVFEQGMEMLRRLTRRRVVAKVATLEESEIGTFKQYSEYLDLLAIYRLMGDKDTWFDATTPAKVRSVLETYRRSRSPLRLFFGDSETGKDWLSESDTFGRIGRSAGTMCTPLLVLPGECGGGAILTNCIVRIVNPLTGAELYRHPTYFQPEMRLVDAPTYDKVDGFTTNVEVFSESAWDVHARFTSAGKAAHWLAYMTGESFDLR